MTEKELVSKLKAKMIEEAEVILQKAEREGDETLKEGCVENIRAIDGARTFGQLTIWASSVGWPLQHWTEMILKSVLSEKIDLTCLLTFDE